jgi:hypothetical protein
MGKPSVKTKISLNNDRMKRIFFPFRLPLDIKALTAMSFRNKGHLLITILMKINMLVGGKTRSSNVRGIYIIVQRLLQIKRHQGLKGLTSFMKTCSVSTQQALGGMVHPNLTDLNTRVSRTSKGIPKILPVAWRTELFERPVLCRLILSIFAVYRFFLYESPVKVKAITDPYHGDINAVEDLSKYIPAFFKALSSIGAYTPYIQPDSIGSIFGILTQSPTSYDTIKTKGMWSSHRISVSRAWYILSTYPAFTTVFDDIKVFAEFFKVPLLHEIYYNIARFLSKIEPFVTKEGILGRLGLKQEAAGKMRVFAMVDPITQWVLYPLHRFIFDKILSKLKMDGTFNQTKPLFRGKELGWTELYSLDLSSATDRLPISIQANIIDFMFPGLGEKWINILVNREYYLPGSNSTVRYAVGQPMGAYSSWAMLALTHHFIVQVSAWRACVVPVGVFFTDYAILGDDIVIANKAVKDQYLTVLKLLGVECGLHKSILSPSGTALEFAKRTWHQFIDVSPITVKELAAALISPTNLVSLMRHHQVPLVTALKVAGFGYKVTGGLNKPFGKLNVAVRNTILTTILPSEIESSAELFGRSSLTSFSWNPEMGSVNLLDMLNTLLAEQAESLLQFISSNRLLYSAFPLKTRKDPNSLTFLPSKANERFTKFDVASFSTLTKQTDMASVLLARVNQTVDALKNPVWASMTDPLQVLLEYLYVMREVATIKGMTNTESASAKFGMDPFTVKMWKLWSKVVAKLSRFDSNTNES